MQIPIFFIFAPRKMLEVTYEKLKKLIEANIQNPELCKILTTISIREYYCKLISVNGETLLHACAMFNNHEIALFLLQEMKVDPNLDNFRGTSALIYAVMENATEVVRVLLQFGAHPRWKSGYTGLTPKDTARSKVITALLTQSEDTMLPLDLSLKCRSKFNFFHCFYFRWYMARRLNLQWFFTPNKNMVQGTYLFPESKMCMKDPSSGWEQLNETCYKQRTKWQEMMKTEIILEECVVCGAPTKQHCSRCKQLYLCSKDCQKLAHMVHKFDCKG
jgi:hypothetical protein